MEVIFIIAAIKRPVFSTQRSVAHFMSKWTDGQIQSLWGWEPAGMGSSRVYCSAVTDLEDVSFLCFHFES